MYSPPARSVASPQGESIGCVSDKLPLTGSCGPTYVVMTDCANPCSSVAKNAEKESTTALRSNRCGVKTDHVCGNLCKSDQDTREEKQRNLTKHQPFSALSQFVSTRYGNSRAGFSSPPERGLKPATTYRFKSHLCSKYLTTLLNCSRG